MNCQSNEVFNYNCHKCKCDPKGNYAMCHGTKCQPDQLKGNVELHFYITSSSELVLSCVE